MPRKEKENPSNAYDPSENNNNTREPSQESPTGPDKIRFSNSLLKMKTRNATIGTPRRDNPQKSSAAPCKQNRQ